MAMTAADYALELQALLPPGRALAALLAGLAQEFARVDASDDDLLDEAFPDTTVEMLPDWERVAGLPDECVTGTQTIDERRQALLARLASNATPTPAFLVSVATALGYDIMITEHAARRYRTVYGTLYGDWPWDFAFSVALASGGAFISPRTYGALYGEPYAIFNAPELLCTLGHYKPAHTRMLVAESDGQDELQWQPDYLFTSAPPGRYYNFARRDSLFQDTAGTVPVTGYGQAVKYIKDLSGNGGDLTLTAGAGAVYAQDANGHDCLIAAGDSWYAGSDADLPVGSDDVHMLVAISFASVAANATVMSYGKTSFGKTRALGLNAADDVAFLFYGPQLAGAHAQTNQGYVLEAAIEAAAAKLFAGGILAASEPWTYSTLAQSLSLFGGAGAAVAMTGAIYGAIIYAGDAWPRAKVTQFFRSLSGA